jgi:hypothetical protein
MEGVKGTKQIEKKMNWGGVTSKEEDIFSHRQMTLVHAVVILARW